MIIQKRTKIYKAVAAAAAAILAAGTLGVAAEDGGAVISVSGKLKCGHSAGIGIRIFAPKKGAADLAQAAESGADVISVMPYQNQGTSDKDGGYAFTAEIKGGKSGIYTAYIGCSACGETETQEVLYSNLEETKTAFELLKQAVSANDEKKTIEIYNQYSYSLGFVSKTDEMSTKEAKEKLLYSYLRGKINECTPENVRYVYAAAAVSAARGNAKFGNLFDYADEIGMDKTEIGKFLSESFVSDKLKADMSARFCAFGDGDLSDAEGFSKCIKDCFILACVRYPNGYGNAQKVLENFKSYIGYTALSSNCAAYISGKDYKSVRELNEAIGGFEPSDDGNGGNSGGNGGGRGGSSSGFSNRITPDNTKDADVPQTIDKNIFDDIDDVSWARESIISLAQLKIINGREKYRFFPNESITREEAVKILICAFFPDSDESEIPFTDVDDSMWYAAYVKKAFGKGLAKGIGTETFGVGENITRQDLAVLCGNVLRLADEVVKSDDDVLAFDDDGDISEYAKDSIYLLKGLEIINGNGDGRFEPKSDITRAEAAKMIYGLYKYLS